MTIQEKIKSHHSTKTSRQCSGDALFVHSDGTITDTGHLTHDQACKVAGTCLKTYLNSGGCRIKARGELIVVECSTELTPEQINAIGRILRSVNCYELIVSASGEYIEMKTVDHRILGGRFKKLLGV